MRPTPPSSSRRPQGVTSGHPRLFATDKGCYAEGLRSATRFFAPCPRLHARTGYKCPSGNGICNASFPELGASLSLRFLGAGTHSKPCALVHRRCILPAKNLRTGGGAHAVLHDGHARDSLRGACQAVRAGAAVRVTTDGIRVTDSDAFPGDGAPAPLPAGPWPASAYARRTAPRRSPRGPSQAASLPPKRKGPACSGRPLPVHWWRMRGSNPRPRQCHCRALPTELIPQWPCPI